MKEVVNFNEVNKFDRGLVGGKGANLGEMINNGFNVPEGFIVTTEFYKKFIEQNCLKDFIKDKINSNLDVKEVSKLIQEKFMEAVIPKDLEVVVDEFLKIFDSNVTFAVRSSATAEDLANASFAGQQDTYLNIKKEDVLFNIKKCFASLYNDRAILYRSKNSVDNVDIEMAVVIQRMILADIAGIMFTANPVNGDRNIVSMDASYGLGEALVSGLVTPDTYYFDKVENKIKEAIISDKEKMISTDSAGGVKFLEIEDSKKKLQVLSNQEIQSLANLGIEIEKHYGKPQDIEWCMIDGKFYITQSRDITSLYPIPCPSPLDNDLHVYASLNHTQVMLDPISPLGINALNLVLPFEGNKGKMKSEDYKYFKRAAGRVYIDLTTIMQSKALRKKFINIFESIEKGISDDLKELEIKDNFDALIYKDKKSLRSLEMFMAHIGENIAKNITYRNPEKQIAKVDNFIQNKVSELKEQVLKAKSIDEKLDLFMDNGINAKEIVDIFPIIATGIICLKKLMNFEKSCFGTTVYSSRITKGLEGNITANMGLLMGDLADLVRDNNELLEIFESKEYEKFFDKIEKLKNHDEFKEKFNSFMDIYDMRAAKEIDIKTDRWSENPIGFISGVLSIVKNSNKGEHRVEYSKVKQDANNAIEEFLEKVKAEKGLIKAKEIKRLIKVARIGFSRREHPKYLIMKIILELKKVVKEIAKTFKEEGRIENVDDIFYLGYFEIREALKSKDCFKELIAQRKEEYEKYEKLKPARVITSTGEEVVKKVDINEPGILKGVGASAGKIRGIAKVINDPNTGQIKKGEILVAPFTDPGWTPLFINAEALVMEIGGMLTHGTVVAREYGIPAVVGVRGALEKIKTGDVIEVDGDNGVVKII